VLEVLLGGGKDVTVGGARGDTLCEELEIVLCVVEVMLCAPMRQVLTEVEIALAK